MTWVLQQATECASPHQVWADAVTIVAVLASIAIISVVVIWRMPR
jgi:hypothetical protein